MSRRCRSPTHAKRTDVVVVIIIFIIIIIIITVYATEIDLLTSHGGGCFSGKKIGRPAQSDLSTTVRVCAGYFSWDRTRFYYWHDVTTLIPMTLRKYQQKSTTESVFRIIITQLRARLEMFSADDRVNSFATVRTIIHAYNTSTRTHRPSLFKSRYYYETRFRDIEKKCTSSCI